jgi:hypothetical protein
MFQPIQEIYIDRMRIPIHHHNNRQPHRNLRRRHHHNKKDKNLSALIPASGFPAANACQCIFENATNSKFTEFNINSTHMKMIMAFRRVSTPATPTQNNETDRKM